MAQPLDPVSPPVPAPPPRRHRVPGSGYKRYDDEDGSGETAPGHVPDAEDTPDDHHPVPDTAADRDLPDDDHLLDEYA